jgi:hypothetical protein
MKKAITNEKEMTKEKGDNEGKWKRERKCENIKKEEVKREK